MVAVEEIRGSTVILKNGGLRQIVMVGGVNFSLKSQEEQGLLMRSYQDFLNGIDFPMQILIHSRKINIQRYIDDLEARAKSEISPLLQNQIVEYREFVRTFVQDNAIMEKSFFIVVSWYPANVSQSAKGLLSFLPFGKKEDKNKAGAKASDKTPEKDITQDLQAIGQRVSQVLEGLATIGLDAVILGEEQLTELFYNLYNPETVERQDVKTK